MKKLNILVLKSYVSPFIATFFIAIFVLLMQFLWKYVDDMVGKGLEWITLAKLLVYASATFVPLALPLAILLSSIMTFGNLAENNELVAIKAAGISLQKTMRPLVILTIAMCFVAFYFSNYILPVANLKFGSLLFDIREQKPAFNIREGIFYNEIEGYVIKVAKKESDGQTVRNIMIYDHTGNMGGYCLTSADSGKMYMTKDKKFLLLKLFSGYNYNEKQNPSNDKSYTYPFQRIKFSEQNIRFDLSSFSMTRTDEGLFKDNYQMLNIKQLRREIDSLSKQKDSAQKKYTFDLFQKFYYLSKKYNDKNKDTIAKNIDYKNDNIISIFRKEDRNKILEASVNFMRGTKESVFYYKEDQQTRKKILARNKIEWHRKFTLSFACLILFFIGAPLGAIIRKGGFGMPVVVSIVFFVIFHVLSKTGEEMVKEGAISVFSGMWMASMILFPVGILLTMKATTDSSIFNREAYSMFLRKIFGMRKFNK
ncbi:MAG: LptF/LptG family permease [Bacteroidales bacterium]